VEAVDPGAEPASRDLEAVVRELEPTKLEVGRVNAEAEAAVSELEPVSRGVEPASGEVDPDGPGAVSASREQECVAREVEPPNPTLKRSVPERSRPAAKSFRSSPMSTLPIATLFLSFTNSLRTAAM